MGLYGNLSRIKGSQSHLQRSERQELVKRCIEVLPLAPQTLKSTKDGMTRRGLNFAVGAENQDLSLSSTNYGMPYVAIFNSFCSLFNSVFHIQLFVQCSTFIQYSMTI